jgi:hypothetical protein
MTTALVRDFHSSSTTLGTAKGCAVADEVSSPAIRVTAMCRAHYGSVWNILAQWPRFRSERDFWRFAHAHLRLYFPKLCSQSQLNRRVRSVEPDLRDFQRAVARKRSSVAFRRST